MDDPQDSSSAGPQERPTADTDVTRSAGGPGYTSDPARAYGAESNPTRAYTTYDSLRVQQDEYAQGEGGYPVEFAEQPRRSSWALVGIGVGVGLLLAAIVGACVLLLGSHGGGEPGTVAAGPSGTPSVTTTGQASSSPAIPPPHVTGLSPTLALPLNALGATMGTVTSNDGVTVLVRRMFGDHVRTVHTDTATKVIGMGGSTVAALKVGDVVVAQGDVQPDGSVNARTILQL